MLKSILMVTILVFDPTTVEQAYQDDLNYQVVDRGEITPLLANSWNTPEMVGSDFVLMQPQSGEPVYLRFVQSDGARNHQAMKSEGWNAVEILVEDPDDLALRLEKSEHFKVVGPPAFLTDKQNIRALQALGPSGELVYLTRIVNPEQSGFGLLPATSYVDRVFIMVVGARHLEPLTEFYAGFGNQVAGPYPYKIAVLSKAYGLPEETLHNLGIAALSNRFLIELDDYPDSVASRAREPGRLPDGIAMVSFLVEDLDQLNLNWNSPPDVRATAPYRGQRSGTLIGPAGEFLELVEMPKQP